MHQLEQSIALSRCHVHGKLRGRIKRRANSNLDPSEEKALLKYVVYMFGRYYRTLVKFLCTLAFFLIYERHPELKAQWLRALDWSRHGVKLCDKVVQ